MDNKNFHPSSSSVIWRKFVRSVNVLGPGLITGASDDDPSGIVTYSQAGAGYGLATLWTALITFPLMAAIQEMCARIGMVAGKGLTGVLKQHYPRWVLYAMVLLSFPAITLNISSDVAGMGAVATLLFPKIPAYVFSIAFTFLILALIIMFPYPKIAKTMKWLCLSLFLYIIVPFLVKQNWGDVLRHTVVPTVIFDKDFIGILVAILGTTISPYLFFWQTNMEVEQMSQQTGKIFINKRLMGLMRDDVNVGMLFSNLVMFFIILATGVVLFPKGIHQIDTVEQAATALQPLAGNMAYIFFTLGVVGTGLLAIPVLAGSLSYIVTETFGWNQGLDKKFSEAKGFYTTIGVCMFIGLALQFVGVSPVKALIYTAILYGLTAPPLIAMILHICNNRSIMADFVNSRWSNILGFVTLALMTTAALVLLYFQFVG